MSIRLRLIVLFFVLGSGAVFGAATLLWQAWDARRVAESGLAVNAVSTRLVRMAGDLAVERGTTNAVLAGFAAAAPAQIDTLRTRRTAAQALLADVRTGIADPRLPSEAVARALGQLERALIEVTALRQRVDQLVTSGADGDLADLRARWFPAMTRLIIASLDLRLAVDARLSSGVPSVVRQAFVHRAAIADAAEYAGQERGFLAGAIGAGAQLDAGRLSTLAEVRGRLLAAWRLVTIGAVDLPITLQQGVALADETHFVRFAVLRDDVVQAGLAGVRYPMAADTWFAAASLGIDLILDAGEAADSLVARELGEMAAVAERNLAIAIGWLVLTALVLATAAITTALQLLRPLRQVTTALQQVARGDVEIAHVPVTNRHDEVGVLAGALESFVAADRERRQLLVERESAKTLAAEARSIQILGLADQIEASLRTVVDGMTKSAQSMQVVASDVNRAAARTGDEARSVSSSSSRVNRSIQTVASAAEELSNAVRDVAGRISQVAFAALQVQDDGERVSEVLDSVQRHVTNIQDTVSSLTSASLIGEAAARELLVNGGVGDTTIAGSLFDLARSSGRYGDQVLADASGIRVTLEASKRAIITLGTHSQNVEGVSSQIAASVEEQAVTTLDIARTMADAAGAVAAIDTTIQGVAESATATGFAAEEMAVTVKNLVDQAMTLRLEMDKLLTTLRSAA